MKEKIQIFLLYSFCSAVFIYLLLCFIFSSFNISKFTFEIKVASSIVYLMSNFFSASLILESEKKIEND